MIGLLLLFLAYFIALLLISPFHKKERESIYIHIGGSPTSGWTVSPGTRLYIKGEFKNG